MTLPFGTVTYLLTDVEGSTRLWERHPTAMKVAMARHDALAAALIVQHGGTLVKPRGEGDSLFAVFPRATDAVTAASALQQAFYAEPWHELLDGEDAGSTAVFQLRVRMALHTGEADIREGDYYGAAVNRAARLRGIAHGGQILLSVSTYELVRDALPAGASLNDVGEQSLRDLSRPERVFQFRHPDLPGDFPPLKSLTELPNNLPRQLTTFIGRERETEAIKQLLKTTCLLTLTGSGGCGKTRLALQAAADLLEEYPDGVWLIELAPLTDPSLVPQAAASVLNVREEPGRHLTQTLAEFLKSQRMLLILDNCEHLLPACAELADRLLRACPNLRILTTSRESLSIAGETTYRVPSLSLPDPRRLPPLESLTQYEAIRLFQDRAIASAPAFAVTKRNASSVAQVCQRLDGIPLAIELAAARVKSLPVEQIAERLDDRFRLLTGGSRTALPRQQTLRALIDWSYDLLSAQERELFHRLSVFVGGFTLEAAESVCADDPARQSTETDAMTPEAEIEDWEILDLLSQLVDRSLLMAEEEGGRVRYRMLETLRQYGREKLAAAGQLDAMQKRHLACYLELMEEAERKLRGSEQAWWLERLETEHDNLRAALSRNQVLEQEPEAGLKLAGALWWFWHVRGHFAEGREWLIAKLAAFPARTAARAKALNGAAVLARDQGDYPAALALSSESMEIKQELGDRQGYAASLNNLGTLALSQGDYATARPFYEQSLAMERELGNRQSVTSSLIGLGNVSLEQGDYDAARAFFEESLLLKKELGDKRGIATSLSGLGTVAECAGDFATARSLHEESLSIRRLLGDRRGISDSLNDLADLALLENDPQTARTLALDSLEIRRDLGNKHGIAASLDTLGRVAQLQGDRELARARYVESLTVAQELGNPRGIAQFLKSFAGLAFAQGKLERAARLFGAAAALRKSIGRALPLCEIERYEQDCADLRAALGPQAFEAAWEAGRTLSPEAAVAFALHDPL